MNESDQAEACAYLAMQLSQLLPQLDAQPTPYNYPRPGRYDAGIATGSGEASPSVGTPQQGGNNADFWRRKQPYAAPVRRLAYGGDATCGQCGLKFYLPKDSIDLVCPRCGANSVKYMRRYADADDGEARNRGPGQKKPEASHRDNDEARPRAGHGLFELLLGPDVFEGVEFDASPDSDMDYAAYTATERPPVSYDQMLYNCYQLSDTLKSCR